MADVPKWQGKVSKRLQLTDKPVIDFTRHVMSLNPDAVSLGQGIVYWGPPPEALDAAASVIRNPATSLYGPNEGLPELRKALEQKLEEKNGLPNHKVCVTHGANQAFVNLVLTLVDAEDDVVVFRPVYFDHLMTLTQTGGASHIVWGECDPVTLHPDVEWLRMAMAVPKPPRLVVLCNPCNPTGVLLDKQELDAISSICAAAGSWLVVDETYEDFVWEGRQHYCVCGPHVVHIFSFSKAYGLMGWRIGYIAYMDSDGTDMVGQELLKCQDTICICATQVSQHAALAALNHGEEYKQTLIKSLEGSRTMLLDALSPVGTLGNGIAGGEGGIYFWARLPKGCEDDVKAVEWLVKHTGVCVVPGHSCAQPGWVRCSFGNLPPGRMIEACARLKKGLRVLVKQQGLQVPE